MFSRTLMDEKNCEHFLVLNLPLRQGGLEESRHPESCSFSHSFILCSSDIQCLFVCRCFLPFENV